MTDGVVIINGPTNNHDGALDYYLYLEIDGGFLVAAGNSNIGHVPSTSSTQYSIVLTFPSIQAPDSMVHVESEDGTEILTLVPTKTYQSLVLCSPELKNGSSYLVYTGGSSTGIIADGLYSDGTYTAGTLTTSFTISDMVTSAGSYESDLPGTDADSNIIP